MTYVYLGNLSVADIEKEHGFEFTEDESAYLRETHHSKANFKDGEAGWHMFNLPPFLAISKGEVGNKVLEIFTVHNADFKFQFNAGYGNESEAE